MESKNSSRTKARLIVMTVFVIGFAAGALSLNLYHRLTSAASPKYPEGRTGVILQKMNERVGLTSDQLGRIKEILDETGKKCQEIGKEMRPRLKDFEPRFDAILQQSRDEIRSVLDEKQLPKYEEMVREQDRIRKEREAQ
jgi:hypothetical protein